MRHQPLPPIQSNRFYRKHIATQTVRTDDGDEEIPTPNPSNRYGDFSTLFGDIDIQLWWFHEKPPKD
ncbi:hypothetical protein HanPSC8_Chr03g0087771 [Helianthus annuus]|nr:hypothetical protein HanPSC8_Chr03g0087771 [Helianthus annuus]